LSTFVHIPVCDSAYYQVQVSIQGGRAPYEVDGLQGVLNGTIFLSDPIPIDDDYQLYINDQDGCTKIVAGDACPCVGIEVNTVAEAGLFCGAPCTPLIASGEITSGDSLILMWNEASGSLVGFGDSVTVCDTGLYIFTARDPISGCEARSSTRVDERELIADTGPDTILNCYNPTIQLGGPDLSYGFDVLIEWSGPGIDSTNNHLLHPVIDEPGQYNLLVLFEEYGCGDSNTVNIAADFNYPFANAGEDKSLSCNSGQVIYLLGSGTLGENIQYTWSGPGIHEANRDVQDTWVNQAGTYQLTVSNLANGCFARDTVEVFPFVPLSFSAEALANSCWNFPEGIVQFSNATGGSTPYYYSLNGQFFTATNPLTNVPSGTWEVVIRDANGCLAEPQAVTIDLIPQLNLDLEEEYSYCDEGEITIDATITDFDGELSYLWSNGVTEAINTYVGEPGDHWVEVTNQCETIIREFTIIDDSDVSFNIQENFAMPNAFSPDGDDQNDTFGPILEELELIDYQFIIYNRWGQKVFESDDPDLAWDGRVNGKAVAIDVYLWKLNARTVICDGFEEDIILRGEVTVVK
jgi:gliding motility-associated-like protein